MSRVKLLITNVFNHGTDSIGQHPIDHFGNISGTGWGYENQSGPRWNRTVWANLIVISAGSFPE